MRGTTPIRDKLERALALIGRANSNSPAFLRIYADRARAEADASDARHGVGAPLGPLDGKIVSIKDLFDIAGETTLAGSALKRGAPPATKDAPVIARLRRAGAVIIGRTNMSEFAFSGLGLNPHYGTPLNAQDPLRAPGGSSSGAAVSVAEGTSEIAIGSDTGGSTRIPAAFNGIVGFKPTARRVPTDGVFPLSYTLDSIGPLAMSVEDCALADAIMADIDPAPLTDWPLGRLRLGVPRGAPFELIEPGVASAFEAALEALEDRGVALVEIDIDDLIAEMRRTIAAAPIVPIEAAEIHADWLTTRAAECDPRIAVRIEAGSKIPAAAYIGALRRRKALIGDMERRLAGLDAMILPTAPLEAPLLAPLEADAALFARTNMLALRNPTIGNFFDMTGISLPSFRGVFPVGVMLLATGGGDRRLLAQAKAIETIV